VTYPRRTGTTVNDVDGEAVVTGIHTIPLRTLVYANLGSSDVFGLRGYTNGATILAADGETPVSVQQGLFDEPDIVSVQSTGITAEIFRHLVDQYLSLLAIVQITALALAALIAFNSATIALDERAREHATMFAFGTRLRTVVGLAVAESALLGLIGTLLGLVGGRLLMEGIVRFVMPDVVPDVGFVVGLSATTIIAAIVLGTLAVGVAPILGARRLATMDVPSALRVVE
jgi:putative ABC transport system permease protein